MAFTKITNTELNSRGATTLPNQPTISAAALKQEFDAPAKEIVAPHFNGLIDELEADTAGASIGLQAPSRRTGSTVKAVVDAISQDLVTVEGKLNGVTNAGLLDAISLKHGHENKALLDTYDQTNEDIEDAVNQKHSHSNKSVIDKWSESEGGAPLYNGQPMTGDMYSSEYDPDSTVKNAGGIETYVTNGLGTKVDKVDGKGLSTNDFTDALKTKLDNIETGAEVNVQSDWDEDDSSSDAFIQNKPTLGTAAYKNSTSVVTDSTDLVESSAVKDIVGWGNKNLFDEKYPNITTTLTYRAIYVGNGEFTMSSNDSGSSTFSYLFFLAGNVSSGASSSVNGVWNGQSRTVTSVDGYVTVAYRIGGSGDTPVNSNTQIEKGDTATAYEPYHASVEDTLKDAEVIEGKNLNYPSYNLYNRTNPFVESGLTVTFNKNGSVTINGTLASRISIDIHRRVPNNNDSDLYIGVGDYKVSVNEGFQISAGTTYNSASYSLTNTGTEVDLSITSTTNSDYKKGNAVLLAVYLWINAGTYNNAVIYPMISKEGGAWKPYTFPLKDVVPTKANNSVIGTVENGTTASQAYAVGSHFIRNGAFCTCTQAIAQGGTFTLNTNYTAGDVAEVLTTKVGTLSNFNTNISRLHQSDELCLKYGNIAEFICIFRVNSAMSGSNTLFKTPFAAKNIGDSSTPIYPILSANAPFDTVGVSFYVTKYNEVKVNGNLPEGDYIVSAIYICN